MPPKHSASSVSSFMSNSSTKMSLNLYHFSLLSLSFAPFLLGKKYENKAKWTTTTKKQNKKINVTGIRILSKSYYSMMFSVLFFHDLRLSTSRCSRNEFLEESKTESEKMTEIEAKDRGACFSMCCESFDGGRVLLWSTKQLFLLMTKT